MMIKNAAALSDTHVLDHGHVTVQSHFLVLAFYTLKV